MKKKLITPEKKPNLYLMWTKRIFWSLLVLVLFMVPAHFTLTH